MFLSSSTERENMAHPRSATDFLLLGYKHFPPNRAKRSQRSPPYGTGENWFRFVGAKTVLQFHLSGAAACLPKALKKHTAPPERNYLFSLAINISLLTERRRLPEVGEILVSLCRSETLKKHTAPPERNYLFFSYKHFAPNGAKTVTRAVGEILVSLCRRDAEETYRSSGAELFVFYL
jgi:hypothetical protein